MIEQSSIIAETGILYIAYGTKAREQAAISISTVRKFAPGMKVAVVGDVEVKGVVNITKPQADPGARTYKTQMYRLSPFERTLFLDADTEMVSNPDAGFNLLSFYDLVLAQDVTRIFINNKWPHLIKDEVAATAKEIGTGHHMYFNSGVIFFRRNDNVAAMMDAWHKEWLRWQSHDQMALLRAIVANPVRIAPIRAPWNTHHKKDAAFIYHKHRQARQEGAPQ